MSISILNRGASGGLKPELTVTAPSGSTIDLLQNGIIVATYTLGASETEHTFVVKIGTYTVRGALGTKTAEAEVVIDVAGQYAIEIDYKLWLYRDGVEKVPLVYKLTASNGVCQNDGTNIVLKYARGQRLGSYNSYAEAAFATQESIDMSKYSTLNIEGNHVVYPGNLMISTSMNGVVLPINSAGGWRGDLQNYFIEWDEQKSNGAFTKRYNLSKAESGFIHIGTVTDPSRGGGSTVHTTISKVWLE